MLRAQKKWSARCSSWILPNQKPKSVNGYVDIQSPCSDFPPLPDHTENGIRVYVVQACANVGDVITVVGEGFWPNEKTTFYWQNPIGGRAMATEATSDADGKVVCRLGSFIHSAFHCPGPDNSSNSSHQG